MYRGLFCSVQRTGKLSEETKIPLFGLSQITDYYSKGEGTCSIRQFIYFSFILLVLCLDIHLLGVSILCRFNGTILQSQKYNKGSVYERTGQV